MFLFSHKTFLSRVDYVIAKRSLGLTHKMLICYLATSKVRSSLDDAVR